MFSSKKHEKIDASFCSCAFLFGLFLDFGSPRGRFFAIFPPETGPRRLLFRCFFENGDFVKIVLPLWREHNFEGSDPPKFGSGSDSEQRRQQTTIKIASGAASGRTFSAPGRFLVHFGSILGPINEKMQLTFWSILDIFRVFSSILAFAAISVDFSCPRRPKMSKKR